MYVHSQHSHWKVCSHGLQWAGVFTLLIDVPIVVSTHDNYHHCYHCVEYTFITLLQADRYNIHSQLEHCQWMETMTSLLIMNYLLFFVQCNPNMWGQDMLTWQNCEFLLAGSELACWFCTSSEVPILELVAIFIEDGCSKNRSEAMFKPVTIYRTCLFARCAVLLQTPM